MQKSSSFLHPYITTDIVPNQYHDLDDFLTAVDFVAIMVKYSEVKENMNKLVEKVVLDCYNISHLPEVY